MTEKAVWKYALEVADGEQSISMPKAAKILCVAEQHGDICLWALVRPAAPAETRKFVVYGTGFPVGSGEAYVGSAQISPFVWHVFEVE